MNFYKAPYYSQTDLMQTDEKDLHFPFSDDEATYDGMKHQYRLTRKYFETRGRNLEIEVDGTSPTKIDNFLNYLQTKVYNRIYLHSKSPRAILNYIIAQRGIRGYTPFEYRRAFLEAMYLEGCYLLDNGDISKISGVDLDTMQNMSIDVIRRQDRDFDKEAGGILLELGLNYYGRYKIQIQGMGVDW